MSMSAENLVPPRHPKGADSLPAGARRIAVVAEHTTVLLARDPGTVIAYSVMSAVLLTVLQPVYQRLGDSTMPAVLQETPGIAVMFTLLALDVAGQTLLSERTWRTWDRLRAGSVRPAEALLGKALPLTAFFAAQQAVLFGFAAAVFGFDLAAGSWRLVLMVLSWALCVSCCGLALGVAARTQGQLAAAADVGALTITCLSGCLVPLSVLPHWVGRVAPFTPGYWALRGFQASVTRDGATYGKAIGIVLSIAAAALVLAAYARVRRTG